MQVTSSSKSSFDSLNSALIPKNAHGRTCTYCIRIIFSGNIQSVAKGFAPSRKVTPHVCRSAESVERTLMKLFSSERAAALVLLQANAAHRGNVDLS